MSSADVTGCVRAGRRRRRGGGARQSSADRQPGVVGCSGPVAARQTQTTRGEVSFAMATVAEFYRDRKVLITGATGFMGKVLVEKLLRSCPEVATLYVLLRPKGQHSVAERREQLLNAQV